MKTKLLYISSNPKKDLSLDKEYRELEEVIKKSKNRDFIKLIAKFATRIEDLKNALNDELPVL